MWRLLQHGSEAEKFAIAGLVDDDFLMILINRRDTNSARDQHIALPAGITHFVDTLSRCEGLQFNLAGQHGGFFFIEQRK